MSFYQQNNNSKHQAELLSKAVNLGNYCPDSEQDNLKGFLHHPAGFPLLCKKIRFRKPASGISGLPGSMGLCFVSEKYIKPGTHLEITIPLRGETYKFTGKVVLIKNYGDKFEIGLWLASNSDVARIRIVEQICHIETYLKHKHFKEGPFISRESVTQEWINRFAASFPGTS